MTKIGRAKIGTDQRRTGGASACPQKKGLQNADGKDIFFEHHSPNGLHIVHDLVADQIKTSIGKGLAESERLNNYEQWVLLSKSFRTYHNRKIYSAWEESLSALLLHHELPKFATGPAEAKLSELAHLGFSPREATKAAERYAANLAPCTKHSSASPIFFLHSARQPRRRYKQCLLFLQLTRLLRLVFEKWLALYNTYRTSYQGWVTNVWNDG